MAIKEFCYSDWQGPSGLLNKICKLGFQAILSGQYAFFKCENLSIIKKQSAGCTLQQKKWFTPVNLSFNSPTMLKLQV